MWVCVWVCVCVCERESVRELTLTPIFMLWLLLPGVKQALWLTKSKMIKGLPAQVLSLADDPANQIPNQDEMVQNAIKHSRLWDTTEKRPPRQKFW